MTNPARGAKRLRSGIANERKPPSGADEIPWTHNGDCADRLDHLDHLDRVSMKSWTEKTLATRIFIVKPPCLAAPNKYLAPSNKSRTRGEATKKRRPATPADTDYMEGI